MNTISVKMEDQASNWIDLFKWVSAWVSGAVATVWGVNNFISKYFEWKKSQQQSFIEEVIQKKVTPEISELKESIDELKEAIWELKNKIRG